MSIEVSVKRLSDDDTYGKQCSRKVRNLVLDAELMDGVRKYRTHIVYVTDNGQFVGGAFATITNTLFAYLFIGFNTERDSHYTKTMFEKVRKKWLKNDNDNERVFGLFTNDVALKSVSFMRFYFSEHTNYVDTQEFDDVNGVNQLNRLFELTGNILEWIALKYFCFFVPDEDKYHRPKLTLPPHLLEKARITVKSVENKEEAKKLLFFATNQIFYLEKVAEFVEEHMQDLPTSVSSVNDNYMTPKYAWENIKHYIPQKKLIWEPFYGNGESGNFLEELGFRVIHKPIDFFNDLTLPQFDIIVTNPPFSKCRTIVPRLKQIGKPFILLLPCVKIFTNYFRENFQGEGLQIIIPRSRIHFKKVVDGLEPKDFVSQCSFDCFYLCWKMNLEHDITWLD